ncbi:MAG: hypothetical protein QOJ59_5001 [Thermomicrobiales bacterium]|nr:hypothetical protein [Thermomicrobiales bacterium]
MHRSLCAAMAALIVLAFFFTIGRGSGPFARVDEAGAIGAPVQSQGVELEALVETLATPLPATPEPSGSPAAGAGIALVGDAFPLLPAGEPGVVAVIAVGAPVRGAVPIAVRNNSGRDVLLDGVRGVARDQDGAVARTSLSSVFAPFLLPAGQVAVGDVYFGSGALPAGLTFEFEPQTFSVGVVAFRQDVEIAEVTRTADGIAGTVRNNADESVRSPITVIGLCFDQTGVIQGYYWDIADEDELAPGGTTTFTAALYGSGPCDAFLLGATGALSASR